MRVVHIVHIARPLPVDLMDRPHGFGVAFAGVRFTDFVAEFVLEGGEDGGKVAEAFGGLFGLGIPAIG